MIRSFDGGLKLLRKLPKLICPIGDHTVCGEDVTAQWFHQERSAPMAIITVSRGSYSKGREVAEKVAETLGYRCLGREVILEASKEFNIPEVMLVRAIHDAPSILDRFTYGKERYFAYFQTAFLKFLHGDNVVYHGLAGHLFLKGVSHVLKVRIIADMADRIRLEMQREGISREEASQILQKDDEERRKWSRNLYGIDTADPSLYDLVLHIRKITVEDAANIICHTARLDNFKTTFESQKAMDDLVIAAEVKAALIGLKPDIGVSARDGRVVVGATTHLFEQPEIVDDIKKIALSIAGVRSVDLKLSHLVDWSD
jgi:cytidylate kinase